MRSSSEGPESRSSKTPPPPLPTNVLRCCGGPASRPANVLLCWATWLPEETGGVGCCWAEVAGGGGGPPEALASAAVPVDASFGGVCTAAAAGALTSSRIPLMAAALTDSRASRAEAASAAAGRLTCEILIGLSPAAALAGSPSLILFLCIIHMPSSSSLSPPSNALAFAAATSSATCAMVLLSSTPTVFGCDEAGCARG